MSDEMWRLLFIPIILAVWWFFMLIMDSLYSGRSMWTIVKELFKSSKK